LGEAEIKKNKTETSTHDLPVVASFPLESTSNIISKTGMKIKSIGKHYVCSTCPCRKSGCNFVMRDPFSHDHVLGLEDLLREEDFMLQV